MNEYTTPMIYEIECTKESLKKFQEQMELQPEQVQDLILNYPTVYLHYSKRNDKYKIYVGETGDIVRRTIQHLRNSRKEKVDKVAHNKSARMFIIGHKHFNKSLTMDVENRLMHYLLGADSANKVYNQRGNMQKKYYTSEELDAIFSLLWKKLRATNPELFPLESIIADSALFKAAPFHKLTKEQYNAKYDILEKVQNALKSNQRGQVIFVAGEAGTGKTVLVSSIFYDLCTQENNYDTDKLSHYLLVNHKEHFKVYKQIAKKLDLYTDNKDLVCNPTRFINRQKVEDPADVVLIDEAHLLWTQGSRGYHGNNQLEDIIARAKVAIIIFDKKQILRTDQIWESEEMEAIEKKAKASHNYILLKNQLRLNAQPETVEWIRDFIDKREINEIPKDKLGYQIKIFDTPEQLHDEIKKKSQSKEKGLSRLTATFDWEYVDDKKPHLEKYWEVRINDWSLPWNFQIKKEQEIINKDEEKAWVECDYTIDEVGSTYTVQGFDLNYAGVILGPSVQYRDGKIVYDPSCSKNKKAVRSRTLSFGKTKKFAETLMRNETNVLMTRGVNGLYIYAYDKELRRALQDAKIGEL